MVMEDLFLSVKEHKLLKKYKSSLEKQYDVAICVPNVDKSCSQKDVIFGSVSGSKQNIGKVKKFISKKFNRSSKSSEWKYPDGVVLITLSDSEDGSSPESDGSVCVKSSTNCSESAIVSHGNPLDESVCIIESTENSKNGMDLKASIMSPNDSICIIDASSKKGNFQSAAIISHGNPLDESICVIESTENSKNWIDSVDSAVSTNDSVCLRGPSRKKKKIFAEENRKHKHKVRKTPFLPSPSDAEDLEICEVSSTTKEQDLNLCKESEIATTVSILKKMEPAPNFIALHDDNNSSDRFSKKRKISSETVNEDIVVLDNSEVEKAMPVTPRRLRPIVIDGSNVARAHGKVNDVFSAKGIKLCVDYFLNRGHTQVTAFLPAYRRFGDRRKFCPTTDQEILQELEKKQHVVFTPSRRVNGQCISSYDDRFMVQLAEKNGGVIVSNDNFKDLQLESESFKKIIEERLLMYCFVGDEFMVPDDPLGRNGPRLDEYLSFPPDEDKKE